MSEDTEGIEKEIEIELGRISVSSFEADDPGTEVSDEPLSDSETISGDLPEAVLSYLNFIKSSNEDAEKLILQDEQSTSDIYDVVSFHTSESNEDPEEFKEKILLEAENEDLQIATTPGYSQPIRGEVVPDDHLLAAGPEMSISLAHREVEENCRPAVELEDEKRQKWKAERESRQKQNEEEHTRRVQHLEQFEAERIKLDLLNKKRQAAIEDELQKEEKAWRDKKRQHEELIMKLQLQIEEEKKALEEQKEKERRQLAELQNIAAVKIQARFRSFLVRKKYTPVLKGKYEMRKKQKILEEIEREMKEREEKLKRWMEEYRLKREEERKRQEELERQEYLKQVKRLKEYEKKKESLRLEREKQLQIRREEQRKLEQKRAKAVMSKNVENNIENIRKDETENAKVIREEKEELNKHVEEQKKPKAVMSENVENNIENIKIDNKTENMKVIRDEKEELNKQVEEQKNPKAVMSENVENNIESIKIDNKTENMKVIRDEKEELNKQVEEQKEKHVEMMDETNNWMIPAERNLTPSVLGSEEEHTAQVNNENLYINSVTQRGENYSQTSYLDKAPNSYVAKDESLNFGATDGVENKANSICSSPPNVQPNASNREDKDGFSQYETMRKTVFLMENADEEIRDTWDSIQDVADSSSKLILPDDIERKRVNWMNACKSWSKIYEENQRKQATIRKQPRKSSGNKMPPLSTEKIIHSGPWSTLQQVTTLTLEDLPACSLSTLSECSNLQVLTLRRCGLVALEGLNSCKDLKYINVEENNIQVIDCENLEKLCILILNKNHLSSVCGLDGCKNLQNLELSYNRITRIGGLEPLKNLQQLIVDHNQLISTKGLCEAPTLIHLDCSFNHLTQVEGIENCGLLQVLKLQGNNLQELPRLENHVLLRELYLDDNSISSMRMLSLYWLPLLQILLLSQNRLTELVPLNSFVSLEKLDIKNNCLSDLKDVFTWLSGCHKLKELSLSGNPLLQEKNWRSSLLEVLPSLQFLDGEILSHHILPTTERIKASELGAFQELCQVQIEENIQLEKKAAESEIASSIDSALGQCWYFNQLVKLSIKHRYVHEYGELNITDRDGPEALQNHLKQTSTGCLQENNLFIMGVTENKQVLLDPSKRWITTGDIQASFINSSIPVHQKENRRDQRVKQKSTESCINYSGESKGNNNMSGQLTLQQSVIVPSDMGRNLQHFGNDTERLHMAASLIQSFWRRYHAQRKNDCNNTETPHFIEPLRQKHEAATVIQAFWKGFLLRKKLASALADVKSDEVEDEYEEINVDAFTFSEAALEEEWLTLDSTRFPSKTLLLSNQLHWPKEFSRPSDSSEHSNSLPLSPQEVWQCANRPHSYSAENIHFHSRSRKETVSRLSNRKEKKKFLSMSEKEEKISEEWGFKDISTAQLMLKRAHKMKPKKHSNTGLDPAVRLALFKNNENKHLPVKPPRKTQPINAGYFEGKNFSQLDTTLDEKLQRKDFTYQWVHGQLSDYEAASSRNMKCSRFLPELDPAICDDRQVQLVASPVSREDMDLDLVSMASGSALTENREKNKPPHRHSARSSKKNTSAPEKSRLGPSHTERISFRDHPVQLSGGWGAGKKRQKPKNVS